MSEPVRDKSALFDAAVEIADEGARAAFLEAECPDATLRSEVEDLLRHHFAAGDFLSCAGCGEESGSRPTLMMAAVKEGDIPVRVGPYKLLEVIGEGGMGTVYMAEQTRPVKRMVALKLIKPGMDSRQVLARFDAERQALALMDHPHIAKVLDAGTTEEGRPYFVMELVKGVPITQFCDERRLSPRERLELFIPVCQAVQHAHQKGIIHRDIKPSNVMVALYDGKPVPKVIDFGVAKAMGEKLTEATLYTGFGAVLGTLEYMSPEQAELNQLDIDTRSDIYSLGVLLYELLTGTTPIDRRRLKQAAILEVLRVIREEEPQRPSTRLGSLSGVRKLAPGAGATVGKTSLRGLERGGEPPHSTLASIAAMRHTEPAKLLKLVRGELDWVVMKALEKDRERRYETANGLADDLQRYLDGEQVEAAPPNFRYRLGKSIRRHRVFLTTVGLVGLALVIGTGVSIWQALRANRAEVRTAEALRVAEERRALSDRHLYAARIHLAREALDRDQVERAQELLDEIGNASGSVDPPDFVWGYLRKRARRQVVLYPSHSGKIEASLQLFDEGRRLLYATTTREICILDIASETVATRLTGHTLWIHHLALSEDEKLLASAGVDESLRRSEVLIWDLPGRREVARLEGFSRSIITNLQVSRNGQIVTVGAIEEGARFPSLHSFDLQPDPQHPRPLGIYSFQQTSFPSHQGRVLHAGEGGEVSEIDVLTGQTTRAWPASVQPLALLVESPDGRLMLEECGTPPHETVVHDLETGTETRRVPLEVPAIDAFYSEATRTLVLLDARYRVWDLARGTCVQIQPEGVARDRLTRQNALSQDGRFLAISTHGNPGGQTPLQVFEVATGRLVATYPGRPLQMGPPVFAPDGRSLYIGSGNAIKRWWLEPREPVELEGHQAEAWSLAFSPDGRLLLSGSDDVGEDRTLRVWDLATGRCLSAGHPVPATVSALAVAPDGKRLATAAFSTEQNLKLWDTTELADVNRWTLVRNLEGHNDRVRTIAFSPDGRTLASGGVDRTIRLWDGSTGERLGVLDGHENGVRQVAFSPDGKHLASASNDGTVRIWRLSTRECVATHRGPSPFTTVAFSPTGGPLAVADQQGLIAFLHPTTGRELSRIFSEDSEARTLCFSPDGRNLVEAGMDKMIRIWDVLTGQELLTLEGHAAQINALAFSPDGSTLASADHGGAVRLWHAREERDSGPVPVVHHDGPDPTRWARLPARRACSGCEERDPKPD